MSAGEDVRGTASGEPGDGDRADLQERSGGRERGRRFAFLVNFAVGLCADAAVCAVALLLWSSLGYGEESFDLLGRFSWLSIPLLAICVVLLGVLYLLDYFWPQHLPHHCLQLYEGDPGFGHAVLGAAALLFVAACLLRSASFPCLPALMTTLCCPLAVLAAHRLLEVVWPRERGSARAELRRSRSQIVEHGDVRTKILLLLSITGEEMETLVFYEASAAAFMFSFAVTLALWIRFTVDHSQSLRGEEYDSLPLQDRREADVLWATPLMLAVSNFIFGLFAILRAVMQQAYGRTDVHKNRIIADFVQSALVGEMTEHRLDALRRARVSAIEEIEEGVELEQKRRQYLERHATQAKQLSIIIKVVGCAFVVLLGLAYGAHQLLYTSTPMASMFAGTVVVSFLTFVIFVYVSMSRIVGFMGHWLRDLPAWHTLNNFMGNSWMRALFVCLFAPVVPCIILLSALNQAVRRWRGLYDRFSIPATELPEGEASAPAGDAAALRLTPRINDRLVSMRSWDWLSILARCYVLCFCFVVYTLSAPLLNVGLAALDKGIESLGLHFAVIVIAVFLTGVILFLLPTVPGAIVYMFGGLVISGNCPPKGTDQGFWVGAMVNIIVCFFLKLAACAVQQAGIGGLLGKSLWVRQQAGVHKTVIRCIEAVLRQRGYTAGKVAILCGGPDWPTSVLAGVLGLNLLEMELGTIPIIVYITPLALSGSLYLKKGEGSILAEAADLMFMASILVSMVLWGIASWAVQHELERNREELTRPLAQNVDLEWLDHRAAELEKEVNIGWADVPPAVRAVFALGALVQIMICQAFQLASSYLIGGFEVADGIDALTFIAKWDATEGLFTYPSLALLGLYALTWLCHVQHSRWRRRRIAAPLAAAARELDKVEASWKEEFVKRAEAMELAGKLSQESNDGLRFKL